MSLERAQAKAGALILVGAPVVFFTAPDGQGLLRAGGLILMLVVIFWLHHRFSP